MLLSLGAILILVLACDSLGAIGERSFCAITALYEVLP
jgi:hypothetical protein